MVLVVESVVGILVGSHPRVGQWCWVMGVVGDSWHGWWVVLVMLLPGGGEWDMGCPTVDIMSVLV